MEAFAYGGGLSLSSKPGRNFHRRAPWQTTKQDRLYIMVKDEGPYQAVVEALNPLDQPFAHSEPKTFNVKRRPLLPAPLWTEQTPDTLKTDAKGNLSFGWKKLKALSNI